MPTHRHTHKHSRREILLLSSFQNFLMNGDPFGPNLSHICFQAAASSSLRFCPLWHKILFLFDIIQPCVQQPLFPQLSLHNSSTFAHVCTRPVQTGKRIRVKSSRVSDQLRLLLVVSSFHYITTNPCLFSRILFFLNLIATIPEDRQQRTLSSEACAVTAPAAADIYVTLTSVH